MLSVQRSYLSAKRDNCGLTLLKGSTAAFIWGAQLPSALSERLEGLISTKEVHKIFGSAELAASYTRGSDIDIGIVSLIDTDRLSNHSRMAKRRAYADVMQTLLFVALGFACTSLFVSFFIGDASLGEPEGGQDLFMMALKDATASNPTVYPLRLSQPPTQPQPDLRRHVSRLYWHELEAESRHARREERRRLLRGQAW